MNKILNITKVLHRVKGLSIIVVVQCDISDFNKLIPILKKNGISNNIKRVIVYIRI